MKKSIRTIVVFIFSVLIVTSCMKRTAGTDLDYKFAAKKSQSETIGTDLKFPKFIVSLSPAATEILFAIGAGSQVAAVSDYTDYPESAVNLPKVGGFDGKTISMEKILSFKPEFVYLTNGMHNFLIEQLNAYEIPYYLSTTESIDDVKQEILTVGKQTGHTSQAQSVVNTMNIKLAEYETLSHNRAKKFETYYEVWNSPYITAGNKSFINDVIIKAGGENLFGDLSESYPIVSEESIIARNPKVILLSASSGLSVESVANRSGWKEISAVKNGKIYIIDDNLFTRPGPRIADCVETLYHLLENE